MKIPYWVWTLSIGLVLYIIYLDKMNLKLNSKGIDFKDMKYSSKIWNLLILLRDNLMMPAPILTNI